MHINQIMKKFRFPLKKTTSCFSLSRPFQLQGWLYWESFQKSEANPREVVWMTQDKETTIHIIEDHFIEMSYLVIRGPNSSVVATKLQSFPEVLNQEDVLIRLNEDLDMEELKYTIFAAAIAASSDDRESLINAFRDIFNHQNTSIRLIGLEAASYVDWSEMKELVEHVSRSDPSKQVKQYSYALLDAYDKVQPN